MKKGAQGAPNEICRGGRVFACTDALVSAGPWPHRTAMRRATLLVVLAYAAALVLALIAGRAMSGAHPLVVALVADSAATIAVFAFSMAFDNSSFYDPYWSVVPFPIAWYWAATAPTDSASPVRQALVLFALAFWGARLTWNWYRGWHGLG